MNVLIIPGYGDRWDYIARATKHWPQKYDIQPEIYVFGWNGQADTYDQKWQQFDKKLQQLGDAAIIGISAGASVAVHALQKYPAKIRKVITVCGPVHADRMNPQTLHNKFPVLECALEDFSLNQLPADRVMTMRPYYDQLVPINAMMIEGAHDKRVTMMLHNLSILAALFGYSRTMAEFIK